MIATADNSPLDFLRLLHGDGKHVFEIRAPKCPDKPGASFRITKTGYFQRAIAAQGELKSLDACKPVGIYTTLNPVQPELLARAKDRLANQKNSATKDENILRRRWLFLDIDPVRPAGISATDAEMQAALNLAGDIKAELVGDYNWPLPGIEGMSGNGAYLFWRVDLPNDDDSRKMMEELLARFALHFNTPSATVDTSVYNASRICKVLGTTARKGDDLRGVAGIEDRPHRQSRFTAPPGEAEVVTLELLTDALHWLPKLPQKNTPVSSNGVAQSGENAVQRCIKYIDKMGDAISGSGGHNATFAAACICYRFGLGDDDAMQVMQWFNDAKTGGEPWSDSELQHKLADARKQVEAAGQFADKLNDSPLIASTPAKNAPAEPGEELKPSIAMPGGEVTISDAASKLALLLAKRERHFMRGGSLVTLDTATLTLHNLTAARAASDFEAVAVTGKMIAGGDDGPQFKRAPCSEQNAKLIINSEMMRSKLPALQVLSRCPVLVSRSNGELIVVCGYDRESGVYATGGKPKQIELPAAVELLHGLLADFRFATPSDKTRALAAMITPALVMGGLLRGRAPVDLGEADQSQTGKGYRNKITAAIYNSKVAAVSQSSGGVGGLEEDFNYRVLSGANFIALDNVRGKIDSKFLESFLTEDSYTGRSAYRPHGDIDPSRYFVMMTSNAAEITRDMANRMACVRLLKQEPGYQYRKYEAGGLLEHIRANQAEYLGAVFAIVRAWWEAGKPQTSETRHDFRQWAQVLDWITHNLLNAPPLLDGHQATQERMTNPNLAWLRDVAIAVDAADRLDEPLRAYEILDIIEHTDVAIPGVKDRDLLDDEKARETAMRAIGRRIGGCFKVEDSIDNGVDSIDIDNLTIHKTSVIDTSSRRQNAYLFAEISRSPE